MELPRVPARVFDCTVSEFLQSRADADPSEGEAIAAILQSKGITAPRKLGLLTVEQLALGADVPAGYVATITEALQKAAFYKRALQRAEEGEDTVPAIASSASGASLFAARARKAHPHPSAPPLDPLCAPFPDCPARAHGAGDQLSQLVQLLAESNLSQQARASQPTQAAAFDQVAFSESLKEAFNKPRSWETFDMESKLTTMSAPLSELFPIQHQPPIYAVRKLVTKLKQAEKDIGYTPYMVADLREYLPPAAPEYQRVDARRDDEKDALKSSKDCERPSYALVLCTRARAVSGTACPRICVVARRVAPLQHHSGCHVANTFRTDGCP